MRILHVLDHSLPLQSGYTFRSAALIREQRRLGWETFHLTSPKHMAAAPDAPLEEVAAELTFHRTPWPKEPWSRWPLVDQWAVIRALEARLNELIPRLRPQLLHAHSPALDGLAALGAARRFGLPLVYEIRGFWEDAAVSHGTAREGDLRYRLSRWLERRVFMAADGVVCICEGIRQDLISRGLTPERITVVPNAVDIERFQAPAGRDAELEARLGLQGKKVLGFIGSFYRYEGLMLLLEALPQVLARHPETRLLLVGGGQEAEALRRRATELGLEGQVHFTGRVPNDQVPRYYSLVDLLCYPRLPMRLTELVTPLKPLEAMAQQKPFVASDVGGHRELVRDGETGILFRAGSRDHLAERIGWMLDHPDQWPRITQAGRAFVEQERTWRRSVANYLPLYERLVQRS